MFLKLHSKENGKPILINIDSIDSILENYITTRGGKYYVVCEKFENIYKSLNEYNSTEIIDVE